MSAHLSPFEEGQDAARRRLPRKVPPALLGTKAANRWYCGYDSELWAMQHPAPPPPEGQLPLLLKGWTQ